MAYRLQYKRDTLSNWNSNNPVLLEGEIAIALNSDGSIYGIKMGDGKRQWSALSWRQPRVIDSLGTSYLSMAPSQRAVSESLDALKQYLDNVTVK